jgi:ankyrin repeat protein
MSVALEDHLMEFVTQFVSETKSTPNRKKRTSDQPSPDEPARKVPRLIEACKTGSAHQIRALYRESINENAVGENDWSPLIVATASGHYDAVMVSFFFNVLFFFKFFLKLYK